MYCCSLACGSFVWFMWFEFCGYALVAWYLGYILWLGAVWMLCIVVLIYRYVLWLSSLLLWKLLVSEIYFVDVCSSITVVCLPCCHLLFCAICHDTASSHDTVCFQIRNCGVVEKKAYVSHLVTVYGRNTLSPVSRALLQFYWSLGITWCLCLMM